MISASYLTVTEFKAQNPDVDLSLFPDATVSGMIVNASAMADNYLQYSLAAENIVDEKNEATISSQGNLIVYPRKFPIISVSALSLKLGTVRLDLSLTDGNGNARYDIPSRGKSIVYPYQEISMAGTFSIRNFYQLRDREIFTMMSYRAGYESGTIPSDIKHAISLMVRDLIIRNPSGATAMTQGGISLSYGSQDSQGDTALGNQARTILDSYKKLWS